MLNVVDTPCNQSPRVQNSHESRNMLNGIVLHIRYNLHLSIRHYIHTCLLRSGMRFVRTHHIGGCFHRSNRYIDGRISLYTRCRHIPCSNQCKRKAHRNQIQHSRHIVCSRKDLGQYIVSSYYNILQHKSNNQYHPNTIRRSIHHSRLNLRVPRKKDNH